MAVVRTHCSVLLVLMMGVMCLGVNCCYCCRLQLEDVKVTMKGEEDGVCYGGG